MADNYTQFSAEVFIQQPEKLTECIKIIDDLENSGFENPIDERLSELLPQSDSWKELIEEIQVSWGLGVRQELESRTHAHRLYLYTEEYGNVELVALYISYLMESGIAASDPVLLTWANTCSKPRVGEFSGGACLITSNQIHWQPSADQWADEIMQKCYPKANPHELRVSRES